MRIAARDRHVTARKLSGYLIISIAASTTRRCRRYNDNGAPRRVAVTATTTARRSRSRCRFICTDNRLQVSTYPDGTSDTVAVSFLTFERVTPNRPGGPAMPCSLPICTRSRFGISSEGYRRLLGDAWRSGANGSPVKSFAYNARRNITRPRAPRWRARMSMLKNAYREQRGYRDSDVLVLRGRSKRRTTIHTSLNRSLKHPHRNHKPLIETQEHVR